MSCCTYQWTESTLVTCLNLHTKKEIFSSSSSGTAGTLLMYRTSRYLAGVRWAVAQAPAAATWLTRSQISYRGSCRQFPYVLYAAGMAGLSFISGCLPWHLFIIRKVLPAALWGPFTHQFHTLETTQRGCPLSLQQNIMVMDIQIHWLELSFN